MIDDVKQIVEIIGLILLLAAVVWAPVITMYWSLFRSRGNQGLARELEDGRIEFAPSRAALWISIFLAIVSPIVGLRYVSHHHGTTFGWAVCAGFAWGGLGMAL